MPAGDALNLDDISQTTFYIPYKPDANKPTKSRLPASQYEERDFPEGPDLRLAAYRKAWTKCFDRLQTIIHNLQTPVVAAIVEEVHRSYTDVLPGLPYPELPVICITDPIFGSSFLTELTNQLELPEDAPDSLFSQKTFVTHLHPPDCGNISSAMKSIVNGFVERETTLGKVKRKPATSLANYDITLLSTWYKALCEAEDYDAESRPNLVVFLHEFEQFDPIVMQDVFYICSTRIPDLPLVFILSTSSPTTSWLHTSYSRATLARLRVRRFALPSGAKILEDIILKTFFDVEFEPDVMIGPANIQYLQDYFTRYDSSLDKVLTILQLIHLKHFSSEPLTVLIHATPGVTSLSKPTSFNFIDSLAARLYAPSTQTLSETHAEDWRSMTIPSMIQSIDEARTSFRSRARGMRVAFGFINLVQCFMVLQGYKGLGWGQQISLCDVFVDVLEGSLEKDIKYLGIMVRKLKVEQLRGLLDEIHSYFSNLPTEEEAQAQIASLQSILPNDDVDLSELRGQVATGLSDWLIGYLNSRLTPLEESHLWDIWYTGLTPFPSELLNPSVRASIISGLLRPHDFAERDNESEEEDREVGIWELPDTSILFKRYLDSGKMINVYDWFESFKTVLETQVEKGKSSSGRGMPKKQRGKGKGREKGKQKAVESEPGEGEGEEEEEKWKLEVQARFMRAMQELDYLGFLKHTGRKADHVLRLVFDVND